MATAASVRVLGLLSGDIQDEHGGAYIKYGKLFATLATHCELIGVHNVELRRTARYENAVRTFRLPRQRWREAFYKNPWAFMQRRQRAAEIIGHYQGQIDVVFQHGAIFNAYQPDGPPVVMYTDFTYRLAQREDPWRDPFTTEGEREHWNQLETEAYQSAAFVLTRSEYARQSVINDYGIAPERVVTVGGGVNFDQLPRSTEYPAAPRVLFVGKHFERKGGPLLVAAFERVRQRIPDAELWLVTERSDVRGPGIVHVPPTHDRAAISALYAASGVFAMPSQCETWGDVFLEAMAHGLPCIGTTNDAMPEIIQHGATGYVVPSGDVAALAQHLERLLGDPDLRKHMGSNARQRVEQLFTWEHVVGRMVPYFELAKTDAVQVPHVALT